MSTHPTPTSRSVLPTVIVLMVLLIRASAVGALEVGQPAPDFSLDATTGGKISLSQFRGKQPVLIEFYGAAFAPV